MPVFNTDIATIAESLPLSPAEEIIKSFHLLSEKQQKILQYLKKMLYFVTETATVQAQEQRAKDAKSFRRLYASDENSMLIS